MQHWQLSYKLTRRHIPRDKTKETRHNKKRKVNEENDQEESDISIKNFSKMKEKSDDYREKDSETISPSVKNFWGTAIRVTTRIRPVRKLHPGSGKLVQKWWVGKEISSCTGVVN